MRTLLVISMTVMFSFAKAGNPYHNYLLMKAALWSKPSGQGGQIVVVPPIPRYQIPKGAVFCIMEDKLTKATGIWIKIGVK